jgi:hypothetical protein
MISDHFYYIMNVAPAPLENILRRNFDLEWETTPASGFAIESAA